MKLVSPIDNLSLIRPSWRSHLPVCASDTPYMPTAALAAAVSVVMAANDISSPQVIDRGPATVSVYLSPACASASLLPAVCTRIEAASTRHGPTAICGQRYVDDTDEVAPPPDRILTIEARRAGTPDEHIGIRNKARSVDCPTGSRPIRHVCRAPCQSPTVRSGK